MISAFSPPDCTALTHHLLSDPSFQVTAPWAALISLLGVAAHVPGVLLQVEPTRVLPALLIVVLVHLLAFVVQLAADLRTRRLFIRAEQQQSQGGRYERGQ